jgi:hypothetical protein
MKMPIKRYSIPMTVEYNGIEEDKEGDWVRWDDPLVRYAPELLEALQELYHLIDSAHDGERVFTTEMQKKAGAAIAKATGDQHAN